MEDTEKNEGGRRAPTPAMEDYLEAIYNLTQKKRAVRVKDIAKTVGVKMPTVTNMLKSLQERGFVQYERYEYLELTKDGEEVGKEIDRKHHVLRRFLTDILGVDYDMADEEACMMEHAIGQSTLERLVSFVAFLHSCPRTGDNWLARFEDFRINGRKSPECLAHMKSLSYEFKERLKIIEAKDGSDGRTEQG